MTLCMQVELWDTGNMEHAGFQNMRSTTYWHDDHAVILVYDKGDIETLNELSGWITLAKKYSNNQDILFSLWGNNTENTINPVDEEAVKDFASSFRILPTLVFSVTASTGDNLEDSYKKLVDEVYMINTQQAHVLRQDPDRIRLGSGASTTGQRSTWKEWCCGAMQ